MATRAYNAKQIGMNVGRPHVKMVVSASMEWLNTTAVAQKDLLVKTLFFIIMTHCFLYVPKCYFLPGILVKKNYNLHKNFHFAVKYKVKLYFVARKAE